MTKQGGRPNGKLIHSEAFEAILAGRGLLKKDVAADCNVSASFLADLLAHRGGASDAVAESIAESLGVKVAALFPEFVGWVGPIPDRTAKRERSAA